MQGTISTSEEPDLVLSNMILSTKILQGYTDSFVVVAALQIYILDIFLFSYA